MIVPTFLEKEVDKGLSNRGQTSSNNLIAAMNGCNERSETALGEICTIERSALFFSWNPKIRGSRLSAMIIART